MEIRIDTIVMEIKLDIFATVNIDDNFLKRECFLFKGSKVKIIKLKGRHVDVKTMAGKRVTMRTGEINFTKKNLRLLRNYLINHVQGIIANK